MKTITVEVSDQVAIALIDVADKPMNVFTQDFFDDMAALVETLKTDNSIKGAVIASGKSTFFAGADLKSLANLFGDSSDTGALMQATGNLQGLLRELETCGKPVAAAINGTALGGGLELCLACHYRVAADNPKSVLG
ncbi:MAG: enoyl-CoA hydratase-related protein, partial [Pseudomonadota bacterium]